MTSCYNGMMSFTNEVNELSRKDKAKLLEKGYLFTSDSSILLDGWFAIVVNNYVRTANPDMQNALYQILGVRSSDNAGTVKVPAKSMENWLMPTFPGSETALIKRSQTDRATFFHFKFNSPEDCLKYRLTFM